MAQNTTSSLEKSSILSKETSRSAPPMRRSCQFCRSRKSRCSGELICSACRSRNISCLYGRETHKGRPRNSLPGDGQPGRLFTAKSHNNTHLESSSASNSTENVFFLPTPGRVFEKDLSILNDNQPTSGDGVSSNNTDSEGSLIEEQPKIGASLDQCFKKTFGLRSESQRVAPAKESSTVKPTLFSQSCLSTLIQGLLEQSVRRFSCLITHNVAESPTVMSTWFQEILQRNQALSNFRPPKQDAPLPQELLQQYTTHHVSQLLELWFQHHPLSPIVSKSLILHGFRYDTYDYSLLTIMLAYSLNALGSRNTESAMELHESTFRQIWSRPATQSLSTAQILLLLGWDSINQGELRRGYCYVLIARTLITEFYNVESTMESERINGVAVSSVEQEVGQNVYWTATSITLWMAMHMQLSFQDPSPNLVPFPCSNNSSSAVMQLENASSNYAGLVVRSRLTRQLWALAHVTNVVSAIYILHPRSQTSFLTSGTHDWQADIARRLHGIPQQPPDVGALYEKIRKVLADGMLGFQREMGGSPDGILVISAFQILSTNLLFPQDLRPDGGRGINESFVNEILDSIFRVEFLLLAYQNAASGSADKILGENSFLFSDCVAVLTMALDTCSRSLDQLYDRCIIGSGGQIKLLLMRKAEILKLVTSLLESCKNTNLRSVVVGEANLSEVIERFNALRDKVGGMEGDGLGSHLPKVENSLIASYPDPYSKINWQPTSSQALPDENGRSGWEPPSLQTMMVRAGKSQNTFGDGQGGF